MSIFKIVMAVLAFLGSFAMGLFMPQKAIDEHFMQRDGKIGFKAYLLRFGFGVSSFSYILCLSIKIRRKSKWDSQYTKI